MPAVGGKAEIGGWACHALGDQSLQGPAPGPAFFPSLFFSVKECGDSV